MRVVEASWGVGDGAALVEALLGDLTARYEPSHGPGDGPAEEGAVLPAPPAADPDDARWAVDATQVARPLGAFVVARIEARPVGCGALRRLPGGDPAVGEVKRMYTIPDARGRGVAQAVLASLIAIADELSLRSLVLETGTRQHEALALYRREGWRPMAPYGEYRREALSRCFGRDLSASFATDTSR